MSKRYPPEQRARAVKMVLDHLAEYRSVYAACQAIGPKVGVGVESLRQWTVQAQIDAQQVSGPTTTERQRIKDLEREVRDLKEANEILKAASIFFARELDPRHRYSASSSIRCVLVIIGSSRSAACSPRTASRSPHARIGTGKSPAHQVAH